MTQKTGKKNIVLALIIVLLLVIILLLVILISKDRNGNNNVQAESTTARDVLVTPDNVQQIVDSIKETVAASSYTTSMNVEWYFDNGTAISRNAYIENDVHNTRMVYFDLITADGKKEILYSSPYIPVGATLTEVKLNKDLDKGTYDAIVVYHLVDDNKQELSTVSVAVKLYILN